MQKSQSILHILAAGNAGGIETLCKDYAKYSNLENTFVFVWSGGPVADEMKTLGAKVLVLDASKKDILSPFFVMKNICKENRVTTIIVHHAAPLNYIYAMALKKIFKHSDVYIYAHGFAEVMCRMNKKGRYLRKIILSMAISDSKTIVAISNSVKESLISFLNAPKEKIKVIYNGTSIRNLSNNFHDVSTVPEIIYVGRLSEEKGVENIIKGLSRVTQPFHFTIVGDGVYRQNLESIVTEFKMSERVTFLGTRRDVKELLSKSDIFVHLPICPEGFGITVIEAMSMGLCCICNNSGALPEIITDGVDGYIVEKNDENQFVNRANWVLEHINDNEITALRLSAMKTAMKFSSETFAHQLDELLLEGNA